MWANNKFTGADFSLGMINETQYYLNKLRQEELLQQQCVGPSVGTNISYLNYGNQMAYSTNGTSNTNICTNPVPTVKKDIKKIISYFYMRNNKK